MTVARSQLAARLERHALDWIVPAWPVAPGVVALMTTRSGGASCGAHATLNLGDACGDDPANVAENRRRLASLLPSPPVWLRQVHGRDVIALDAANGKTIWKSYSIADRAGRAIGAAHAGWRGLARGVLESAIDAMRAPPADIIAWLGPAIGPRAFEVGDDVVDAFSDAGLTPFFTAKRRGKWLADLTGIARAKLERCGVASVHGGGPCTFENPDRFFSYRRDRDTGRVAALIWLSP